ncbi:MAG TPA: SpoIID/LytB domain-containing protein [Gaiellaceae bacterium]|nr:SpoIID/LytB domain-containing protein [Gaiellaceae bacterium]
MRCRLSILAFAFCLALAGVAVAAPRAVEQPALVTSTTFAIRGHGYGHGVGMGQWGAYGMAKTGATYDKILGFYYPGTQIGQSPVKAVRVLLADTSGQVAISSAAPFKLKDGTGALHQIDSGQVTIGPGLTVQLDPSAAPQALTGPLTAVPGKAPLSYKRPYLGSIQVQVVGSHLEVVNSLSLDNYVRGVVTGEMPVQWPLAALEAQAVAARSYAVATLGAGKILYTDERSQVYGGIQGQSGPAAQAVAQTKNQVLLYNGQVATTFFSSSSGGRTAAFTDLVPNAKPIPYLLSHPDPYDSASPWHNWGPVVFTGVQVSKAFAVPGITDLVSIPATGHARQVLVTTATGAQKTVSSSVLRDALGLRSTYVTFGLLSLSRPTGTVAPGTAVTLTGKVRAVKGPVALEQSTGGGIWTAGPALTLATDGTFSVPVTLQQTTSFRLTATGVNGQALQVQVQSGYRSLSVASVHRQPRHPTKTAFSAPDPLATEQWYLAADHAFDFWPVQPTLSPVLVGIVDTGIDAGHPDLAGKIALQRSFVGGTTDDVVGHGTFVAGEIAAALGNGQGIAGIAFPARLIVAKVVGPDLSIDPDVEAKAIRWEADRGARVINLSLGAVRDPLDPSIDTFSPAEAAAVQYAVGKGALVVAAVGNGDDAPSEPWPYASYPAALPHVLGVGALDQDGAVPAFSNRDPVYVDLVAPGVGILSTFPRALTALRPTCTDQGYSDCGPRDYRDGDGTSFAAPQVAAAAALIFAVHPNLTADQVETILERSADDVSPATGCPHCSVGRDSLSGWGRLDISAALSLAASPPPRDSLEPNDDAGTAARKVFGGAAVVHATVDYWDDPIDVYAVKLTAGQRVTTRVHGPGLKGLQLALWKPGTQHVSGHSSLLRRQRVFQSLQTGPNQVFQYRAATSGWYDVEVRETSAGSGAYTLRIAKTS